MLLVEWRFFWMELRRLHSAEVNADELDFTSPRSVKRADRFILAELAALTIRGSIHAALRNDARLMLYGERAGWCFR